jgi:hypothetical protein
VSLYDHEHAEPDYGGVWDDYARLQAAEEHDRREHRREMDLHLGEIGWAPNYRGPDPKPVRALTRSQAHRKYPPSVDWKLAVLERDQGCVVHTNPAECCAPFSAHHVVPQQVLRRLAPQALWSPLSGVGVCSDAHRQHHNRVRPIRRAELPAVVVEYLIRQGFGPYLERHYP